MPNTPKKIWDGLGINENISWDESKK